MNETIVTDSATGGMKGQKIARFDLIPPEFEWELAEHYGKGCTKYASRNWERGYAWGLSYGALRRHLNLWLNGEACDPETGMHHLIAVIWHAIALYTFERRGLGTDDLRPGRSSLDPDDQTRKKIEKLKKLWEAKGVQVEKLCG